MTEEPQDDVLEALGLLADRVEGVEDNVDAIIALFTATPGGPWTWAELAPEERAKLWNELFVWVDWLNSRYLANLSTEQYPLPADWYTSPIAVELMTALMVSHMSVYNKSNRTASFQLVEWHERALWPTMARLKDLRIFKNGLSVETPRDRPSASMDSDDFDRFVEADLANHTAPEGDTP